MPRKSLAPDTLFPSTEFGFAQVVVSDGRKLVHCSGQTAWTREQKLVGEGDLAKQLECAFENVRLALAAAGATPADVVRARIYIVDYKPEHLGPISQAMSRFFDPVHLPASTLIGVQALALPEFLVEIEVTASLPA